MMVDDKIKCPDCGGVTFNFAGINKLPTYSSYSILFKCATIHCFFVYDMFEGENLEIIEKGSLCFECKTYNEHRDWNKTRYGYDIWCDNCGKKEFEAE